MKTLPLTEAKAKLSALIDGLAADDEEVVITRNGVAAAVLVSPDEFERWWETLALRLDTERMTESRAGPAPPSGSCSMTRLCRRRRAGPQPTARDGIPPAQGAG